LGHNQSPNNQIIRRRPSLLASSIPNEYGYSSSMLQSSLINRAKRER
jgi:hypothetical protein